MDLATLTAHFDRLAATTKRLERTSVLVDVLRDVDVDDLEATVRLLQGRVRPEWEGVELGLAEKLILKAIAAASGVQDVVARYHEAGDLGLAAEQALRQSGARRQATLFGPQRLQVREAYDALLAIAREEGPGSLERKAKRLHKLLLDAEPHEAGYLVRMAAGRLRLGVADQSLLDALASWHEGMEVRSVQEMAPEEREALERTRADLEAAFDRCSDLARVADVLARNGLEGVRAIGVELGVPLRPMAAERLKTLGAVLERHGGRSALEYKYDGLRVQAHVSADPQVPVRLFSRRMEELTHQFPDVQAALRDAFRGQEAIVEGECVAVGPSGRMRPFQEISRRRGRKTLLGGREVTTLSGEKGMQVDAGGDITQDVPVGVYLFDCMAVDGTSVMGEPYARRRERLDGLFASTPAVAPSLMEVCGDEAAMEAFFQRAVADGAEGVMAKALNAPYKAGDRGFDWIKFKTDYTELVDTMDLAVVGAFYGRGRRAGWYGALLMAAYDPEAGRWTSLCKLGTGFDDATLMGLKERFADHVSASRPPEVDSAMAPDVWLHPAVVLEVQAAELTLSPVHRTGWGRLREGAGLAARFPRFSGRWREDKAPEQATTVEEIVSLYRQQGDQG